MTNGRVRWVDLRACPKCGQWPPQPININRNHGRPKWVIECKLGCAKLHALTKKEVVDQWNLIACTYIK